MASGRAAQVALWPITARAANATPWPVAHGLLPMPHALCPREGYGLWLMAYGLQAVAYGLWFVVVDGPWCDTAIMRYGLWPFLA